MDTFSALLALRGNHRSPMNSPHKGQWRGALMFPLICAWISGWVNYREAGDLRRHRAQYDLIVMIKPDRTSGPIKNRYYNHTKIEHFITGDIFHGYIVYLISKCVANERTVRAPLPYFIQKHERTYILARIFTKCHPLPTLHVVDSWAVSSKMTISCFILLISLWSSQKKRIFRLSAYVPSCMPIYPHSVVHSK